MKTNRNVIITASVIIVVLIAGVVTSYAWLKSTDSKNRVGVMGTVKLEITGDKEVDSDGKMKFGIINTSSIDTYVRLGWTPVFMDSKGEDTTRDTADIELSSVEIIGNELGLDGMVPAPQTIISYGGYEKNMIVMEEREGQGNYFVIPANTSITGRINVKTEFEYSDDYKLRLILVPEAIQATEKAVEEASGYGWSKSKVGKQASTIYNKGGGE